MTENGDSKRPEPPSPDQYERLKQQAETLRQSELSGRSDKALQQSRKHQGMQAYVRYTGLGLQFAILILLSMGLGYLLDVWIGTSPWFLSGGALFGAVGGMIWLVRVVARMEAREGKRRTSSAATQSKAKRKD